MTNHEEPSVYYSSLEGRYLARDGVELRRSFRSPALAFHGRIFAFFADGDLVVKLGATAVAASIDVGHGRPYRTSATHISPAWVLVPFTTTDPHRWATYVEQAYQHALAQDLETMGS
jgi:hypothetical protein